MNKYSIKKKLKERKPKVKCGNCCRSQHLLKTPNSTMENVNSLDPLAEKTNHRQYSDAFKACLVDVMLSFLLFWDSYGVISTHSVRDTLSEFIFTFLSLVDFWNFHRWHSVFHHLRDSRMGHRQVEGQKHRAEARQGMQGEAATSRSPTAG